MPAPINRILTILSILVILSGFGLWFFDYHNSFVVKAEVQVLHNSFATKTEVHLLSLDSRISVSELVVMGYQSKGLLMLNDIERGRYERANARLLTLEAERDKAIGLGID